MNSFCKFKFPKDLSEARPLILINFSNGCLNFNDSTNLSISSYVHKSDPNRSTTGDQERRIVVASSNRLMYKGTNFEEDSGFKPPIRYFIGVRNKVTGRMKCYSCVIIHLKPVLKASIVSSEASTKDMNYREKLDLLAMNFGNKAKKRAVNARLKYAVDTSGNLSDVLENITIKESTTKKLSLGTASGIDYLPPQNRQAHHAHEVYDLRDIISQEEEEHLAETVQTLSGENSFDIEEWQSKLDLCKYVLFHLENNVDDDKLSLLLYYNYMMTFAQLTYSDINKKDPAPSIPEPIKTKLLNTFTLSTTNEHGKVSRNWPSKMKDKLFAYMFVLALIIDDYIVNISSILEGLKRGLQSAINIAQALGCHIVQRRINDSVVKFAELKIPLSIPSHPPRKRR